MSSSSCSEKSDRRRTCGGNVVQVQSRGSGNGGALFPSFDELHTEQLLLIKLVEAGDHSAVRNLLKVQGHEVEIVPKVGCQEIHYSKYNIVNVEDSMGESAMLKASRVDSDMVDIILKYGGNPNTVNSERACPLSEAAIRRDKASVKSLLRAGANLGAPIVKLAFSLKYKSRDCDEEFSVAPLLVLCCEENYIECKDPLHIAFEVCSFMNELRGIRAEFKAEFETIIRKTNTFTCRMLGECQGLYEARAILDSSHKLISKAIVNENKEFIAHHFSQTILSEDWYGEVAYTHFKEKLLIGVRYTLSPFLLPILGFFFLFWEKCHNIPLPKSKVGRHMRLLYTPIMCFITDVTNYLILLLTLIVVCLRAKWDNKPNIEEFVLWACALSRLIIEIRTIFNRGVSNYLRNIWNYVDFIICGIILGSAAYRLRSWLDITYSKSIIQTIKETTYMYAFAEFFLALRFLVFLEVSKSIGYLLIALRHLIFDVMTFVMILGGCIIGSSVAVFCITNNIDINGWDPSDPNTWNNGVPEAFKTFSDVAKNILWSTFGLLDVPGTVIENDTVSTNVIHVLLLLYVLLACVLLLNMLIALLSTTFQLITTNCDMEWKFAKCSLLREYKNGQPFLFPFQLLLFPIAICFRAAHVRRLSDEKDVKITVGNRKLSRTEKSDDYIGYFGETTCEPHKREILLGELCQRYIRAYRVE